MFFGFEGMGQREIYFNFYKFAQELGSEWANSSKMDLQILTYTHLLHSSFLEAGGWLPEGRKWAMGIKKRKTKVKVSKFPFNKYNLSTYHLLLKKDLREKKEQVVYNSECWLTRLPPRQETHLMVHNCHPESTFIIL